MANQLNYKNFSITWLGHSSVLITGLNHVIYIDPWHLPAEGTLPIADLILITHDHPTHLSIPDILTIIDDQTVIITPHDAIIDQTEGKSLDFLLVKELLSIYPGQELKINNTRIFALPAYTKVNPNHTDPVDHDPDSQFVGYLVEIDGISIYHAGDTDALPDLEQLKNIDIALVPVSGGSIMNADQAANFVNIIKPQFAIPIHWGDIFGDKHDADRFKELSKVSVVELEPPVWSPVYDSSRLETEG